MRQFTFPQENEDCDKGSKLSVACGGCRTVCAAGTAANDSAPKISIISRRDSLGQRQPTPLKVPIHRSRVRRLGRQDRSRIPGSQRTREISSLRVVPQKLTMVSVQCGTTTLLLRMECADRRRPRSPWVDRSSTPINKSLVVDASVAPHFKRATGTFRRAVLARNVAWSVAGPRTNADRRPFGKIPNQKFFRFSVHHGNM